jgi:hypothetical protein
LEKLDLRGCFNLTTLPESIFSLKQLKELDLRGCKNLTTLPDHIKVPPQLKVLNHRRGSIFFEFAEKLWSLFDKFLMYLVLPVALLLVVKGRSCRPMPCICDLLWNYPNDGMSVTDEILVYLKNFSTWTSDNEDQNKGFRLPPSCDVLNTVLTVSLLLFVGFVLMKLKVFLNECMRPFWEKWTGKVAEQFTVKVLHMYHPVKSEADYWFSWRRKSERKVKPTIRLDKSCELQVLQIECTEFREVKKDASAESSLTKSLNIQGDVKAQGGGAGARLNASLNRGQNVQTKSNSTFERVITNCDASVGYPWTYERSIPKGGIEVKVRLEEDVRVINTVYFNESGGVYEYHFSGSRRLNSAFFDAIFDMIKDLWVHLVIANKDFLFLILRVVTGSYLVANFLIPSIAMHVDNLQKSRSISK